MKTLVCFFLRDRELAAPIELVRETIDLRPITPLFHVPSCIAGIVNLRGDVLAVLDPGVLLGLGPSTRGVSSRIVVVAPDDRRAGLLVDGVGSIRHVPEEAIAAVPPTVPDDVAALLEGVVSAEDRAVSVLSVRRLLGAPELAPFVRAGRAAQSPTAEESR